MPITSDGILTSKKCNNVEKDWNVLLILEIIECLLYDHLWQIIKNPTLEIYPKSQTSLKEYELAIRRFWAYLFFIIRSFQ